MNKGRELSLRTRPGKKRTEIKSQGPQGMGDDIPEAGFCSDQARCAGQTAFLCLFGFPSCASGHQQDG